MNRRMDIADQVYFFEMSQLEPQRLQLDLADKLQTCSRSMSVSLGIFVLFELSVTVDILVWDELIHK